MSDKTDKWNRLLKPVEKGPVSVGAAELIEYPHTYEIISLDKSEKITTELKKKLFKVAKDINVNSRFILDELQWRFDEYSSNSSLWKSELSAHLSQKYGVSIDVDNTLCVLLYWKTINETLLFTNKTICAYAAHEKATENTDEKCSEFYANDDPELIIYTRTGEKYNFKTPFLNKENIYGFLRMTTEKIFSIETGMATGGPQTHIHSVYYNSGITCVQRCFDENGFKYFKIEVPSDKYEVAVKAMEYRISNGQMKGVTDPKKAGEIVRKGRYTYDQIKIIAKSGGVDSIKFDAHNGIELDGDNIGVSTVLTFAVSTWNGEDLDTALKKAGEMTILTTHDGNYDTMPTYLVSPAEIISIYRKYISVNEIFVDWDNTAEHAESGKSGLLSNIISAIKKVFAGAAKARNDQDANNFIKNWSNMMVRALEKRFVQLCEEYLLNKKEAERVIDGLSGTLTVQTLKDMFDSDVRLDFADELIRPKIEKVISERTKIISPSNEQFNYGLKLALEEMEEKNAEEKNRVDK